MDETILDHNSLDFIQTYLVAPERIRTLGLEANRRGVADHSRVVVAEAAQVPVEGGCRQLARCELLEAVGRIDAVTSSCRMRTVERWSHCARAIEVVDKLKGLPSGPRRG